jgi:uncharacterized protein GlcG (DUF336 family)
MGIDLFGMGSGVIAGTDHVHPLLHGFSQYPRIIIFGGGYPIKEGAEVIGGIGVSGGHYSQDMECALAGLEAIGTVKV